MNYLKDDLSKGFLEAAVAWEVCASIHFTFAKGKDTFYKTRQADFISHANEAREKHAAIEAHPERAPLTMEQCKAKFEAWYASAPDAEPESDRTYELSDESMSVLTKDCIWLGWQAAHGIKGGQHD